MSRYVGVGKAFAYSRSLGARACLFVAASLLPFTGCASWGSNLFVPSVAAARKERATDAVREFEERRDAAQLQTAVERFEQGDAEGSEVRLAAIVERRPEYTEARLRLAEVLAARGKSDEAETQLRSVLEREADRADAHHALGMLLDAAGNRAEAVVHLSRASQLEPENEIYRLTRDSL